MAISTAIDASAVARVVGIKTEFKDFRAGGVIFLPQRVAVIGQGSTAATYSTDKAVALSAFAVGSAYGFGSPLHLAVQRLLPENGDGVGTVPVTVYPLVDDGSGVVSSGDITPAGTQGASQSYRVVINNIQSEAFVILAGELGTDIEDRIADAINAVLDMPVIATADGAGNKVDLVSKWAGVTANDIVVEVVGTIDGITFGITQPVGGLVDPSIDAALAQVGNVWETMFLNCLGADTTALDALSTFGEGRWGALVRKPMVAFYGNTEASAVTSIIVPDARKTDRTNSQLVAPGSNDLPLVVAARQLARIARLSNNSPGHDFGSQPADGLVPGADGVQWDYPTRDFAVKGGSSTTEVKDGVVNIADVVTMYHPTGDPNPAYRFVCDIIKLQNIIFNIDLEFASTKWDGKLMLPDADPTVNPDARKPRDAKAAAAAITDSLGLNALISNASETKDAIQAEISTGNPKRLDMVIPVQLSGNVNIISIDLQFGFFFGTPTVI